MKLKKIYHFLIHIGFNPLVFFSFFFYLPSYISDYVKFKKLMGKNKEFRFGTIYPILMDKNQPEGRTKGAYFHHDLLVARKIYENKPIRHIDIGSRIDGFVAHVAVFRKIEAFDIRPQVSTVKNIVFHQADLMQLPSGFYSCCDSVSSLNAIEHFGLGRYGDPLDPDGHLKAIDNIYKMLIHGGRFYFSVPIGDQRIEFNAARYFNVSYLLDKLLPLFDLHSFSYVDDNGDLFEDVEPEADKIKTNFGCKYYGHGIFELVKKDFT